MVKAVCKRLFEKNLNKDKNTTDKLRRLEEFYIPINFAVIYYLIGVANL